MAAQPLFSAEGARTRLGAARDVERARESSPQLKFARDSGFLVEVRRRVRAYFQNTGKRERDCPRMYLKTATILVGWAAIYTLLVFVVQTCWLAVPLAVMFALSMAMIGMCIQHDGNHRAYSDRPWVNKLMATMLDMIGASSFLWRFQHVVVHHTSPNVNGHDIDIDVGAVARIAPGQKRRWVHRWQHMYLWALYGLTAMRWQLFADFRDLWKGRMSVHQLPRPRWADIAVFFGGKLFSFALLLGIPMLFHSWWVVLLFYALICAVAGVVLSVTFQLAHCVEAADFPEPEAGSNRMARSWAVHQVETTVDFSRRSRLAAWFFGGLNFQIEHHLFPRICHIHYRAIAPIVERTCREFGIRYAIHKNLWSGLASHFRWLRRMGQPEAALTQ
jgi:linoleoyl-CoA desaturase